MDEGATLRRPGPIAPPRQLRRRDAPITDITHESGFAPRRGQPCRAGDRKITYIQADECVSGGDRTHVAADGQR